MKLCFSIFCLIISAVPTFALEVAAPENVGISKVKIAKIRDHFQNEVDSKRIAGSVYAIARHGRIASVEAVGFRDAEAHSNMQPDSLIRIASMTKAITSAAIMMLQDEGKLSTLDPVAKYLPEFQNHRVLQTLEGPDVVTTPATVPITLHHLLTHTSGLTYGWFGPPKLDAIYNDKQINDFFVPTRDDLASRVRAIATMPLKFEPGSNWDYGVSVDVLGRVVEVVSGLTLEQFFYERFFRPLKMSDTHFAVPQNKRHRMASLYTPNTQNHIVKVGRDPITAGFLRFSDDYCFDDHPVLFAGGSGLVSTAKDYVRFLQMLLNGGELEGVRILSVDAVRSMTSNQIGKLNIPFGGHGDKFGYGFGVLTRSGIADDVASVGTYSWGGIFNTYFWVDPQERLIGVMMTQVFPYDQLTLREDFKRLVYDAIDDSGFEKRYWYTPGKEHANPHFNKRQLRVNGAEVSIHPSFATRSEPQSSGMARIRVDEDLRTIRRADLYCEVWGGHPKTENKRVSVNGRRLLRFPPVGTERGECTHQYHRFNLRPIDLVNGYNSLQFACDTGTTFWGHYIVDNASIQVGLTPKDKRVAELGVVDFEPTVDAVLTSDSNTMTISLSAREGSLSKIASVDYQGRYYGYDENGDGEWTDWHGMTKSRDGYGSIGTSDKAPFQLNWDVSMLPAQLKVQVRAVIHFEKRPDIVFRSRPSSAVNIPERYHHAIDWIRATNTPKPFWSRAGKKRTCLLQLPHDPSSIEKAELHVVAWTGGAGDVQEYFKINGHHFPVAEGHNHEVIYSKLPIDPKILQQGDNVVELLSDSEHHGIEILSPGPALVIRRQTNRLTLIENSMDPSAAGLDCYEVRTPHATFYLEKVGGGLSSVVDQDGNDWIGFHPEPGSGAGGEYRGFPNAVFKEAGSYFHPRNANTDPCTTQVVHADDDRIEISAVARNQLWKGRYVFTRDGCFFQMTKMPKDRRFWVLYEGTPGGQYDATDWWMSSSQTTKSVLTKEHRGDITAPEWMAFGDANLDRSLLVYHLEDDSYPDCFYQMQEKMTVFGFGRQGMRKFFDCVPQTFFIGLLETTAHDEIDTFTRSISHASLSDTMTANDTKRKKLEQNALTQSGDPKQGKRLFESDKRIQCSVCHKVAGSGGLVGPDLSMIGGKFDRPHLIESLLQPSTQIVEGYRSTLIVDDNGKVFTGIVLSENDQQLALIDSKNETILLDKADIEARNEQNISLMPEGLGDTLTSEEFTNLVAYLESLRPDQGKFGSNVAGPINLPKGFSLELIATGITGATALDIAPDGRIFVCDQTGHLRVVENDKLLTEPFVSIQVDSHWERGLIGVTVHPQFPKTPYVYICYVAKHPYPHHRLARLTADGNRAIEGSEQILLRGDDQRKFGGNVPAGHQGGAIHFGLDGKLYLGLGEQTAKKPSQDLAALQGKLLRLNADGSIPTDNPFYGQTTGKYRSIWALGLRNPFTFAVDPDSGHFFINDVGGNYEEINVASEAGLNFGWPIKDHGPTGSSEFTDPIHIYPQASISGGDFAPPNGDLPENLRGKYFFADFVHGWIRWLDPKSPQEAHPFLSGIRRPVDLRFDQSGNLYVLLRNAWVIDGKFQPGTGTLMKVSFE